MTYERAFFSSAGREKFSVPTLFLERKIMSTKTTIKRISAVAALALALGGLTSVAANAGTPAPGVAPDFTVANYLAIGTPVGNTETATQIAGPANFVTLITTLPTPVGGATLTGTYFTVTGGTTTTGTTSGTVAPIAASAVNIATPVVGTITVTSYDIINGAASTVATGTVVITVVASTPGTLYASSTVLGAAGTTARTTATDATFPLVATAAGGATAATFDLNEFDANGIVMNNGSYKAVAISTTLGNLTGTGGLNVPATSYITGTPTGPSVITLNANGQVGTATVAISVNGVAVKSYVVIFSGVAAKIVLTAINPVVAKGTKAAAVTANVTANTNAIEVQEFDAAGNVIVLDTSTLSLVSSDATVATVDSSGLSTSVSTLGGITGGTVTTPSIGGYSIAGVAAGTTTFTAKDSTGTLVSNPVTVRVSSATPTSVVFATDAASYPAGGIGSLKTTISDAAGTVPAGTYAVLTAGATSTYALTVGTLPGVAVTVGSITVDDTGISTTAFNAPIADASAVTITGTAAATTITVTPAVFSVTSGGSTSANAAADAAAEATDAANAATDAANAAADSADQATAAAQDAGDKADAALAAVTALSQQVTDLLAKIADLSAANEALATALAAQSAALASQSKTVAAQSKALAAQKALVARLVRKAKA
jgi:hypothetical protein